MKRILLATAATLALSLPAMAQNNPPDQNPPPANQQQTNPSQSQMNNSNTQMGNEQQAQTDQQEQRINPKQLSKQEIKNIQQALNKKGFSAGHIDGIWGRDTDSAVKNFQKKQGLPGNGQLYPQTLAALGVNASPQGEQGTVGSGSNGSMNSGSSQMNNSTNGMNKKSPNGANQGQMNQSKPQQENSGSKY
jgi:peptidoglycan hydrolase-like protein with peptidoglycan-binding domain